MLREDKFFFSRLAAEGTGSRRGEHNKTMHGVTLSETNAFGNENIVVK